MIDRLPANLRQRIVVAEDGCWLWVGHCNRGGYGILGGRPRPQLAHRLVWAALVSSDVPEHLHHRLTCAKRCVNPDHLTGTTNAEHPDSAPRWQAAKTHCKQGHEFTPENTYRPSRGGRKCRTCAREVEARRAARLRAEGR